jgi:hypothetical protein
MIFLKTDGHDSQQVKINLKKKNRHIFALQFK